MFRPNFDIGRISEVIQNQGPKTKLLENDLIRIQCFPVYSFLVTLNVSVVDYLSVDIEGYELEVLKTIPFDKVTFKVVTVEVKNAPGGSSFTQRFMESKGFKTAGKFYRQGEPLDLIFVHKSVDVSPSAMQLIESKYYNTAYLNDDNNRHLPVLGE